MSTKMTLRREACQGGYVPRGWQMAWYEPRRRVGVYYPAPLHWLLRALREIAYRMRVARRMPSIEQLQVFDMQRLHKQRERLADEYASGYLVGWRECYQTCIAAVEEELACMDEAWEVDALLAETPKLPRRN
jgi:hypothetical protein